MNALNGSGSVDLANGALTNKRPPRARIDAERRDRLVELHNRTARRVNLELVGGRVLIPPLGRLEVPESRVNRDALDDALGADLLAVTRVREPQPSPVPGLVTLAIGILVLVAAIVFAVVTSSVLTVAAAVACAAVLAILAVLPRGPIRPLARRLLRRSVELVRSAELDHLTIRLREVGSFVAVALIVVALPGVILFFGSDVPALVRDATNGDHAATIALIGIGVQEICIVGASSLPILLYFVFDRERLRTLRNKFTRQIFRLDPGVRTIGDIEAKYGEILDEAYGRGSANRFLPGTRSPILIATAVITLGWTIALLDTNLVRTTTSGTSLTALIEPTAAAPTFAFLGAYFFTLNQVLRGYVRGDLRPKTYAHVATRIVTVVVLAYLLERLVEGFGSASSNAALLTLAFVTGVVPETVLVRLQEVARGFAHTAAGRRQIDQAARTYETDPLTEIDGIDIYDRARLLDEGVTNVEGLAHHGLVDLLLRTRIPASRLVDWVDQAILYIHCSGQSPDEAQSDDRNGQPRRSVRARLRDRGIRTATELERAHAASSSRGKREEAGFLAIGGGEAERPPVVRVILDALRDEDWMHALRRWHSETAEPQTLRIPEDVPEFLVETPGAESAIRRGHVCAHDLASPHGGHGSRR